MQYTLKIQEHEEHGQNGIVIVNRPHKYFDPATNGLIVAHDLLEHPVVAHPNGVADELMAIGGLYWIRYLTGYTFSGRYSRPLEERDIDSDLSLLLSPDTWDVHGFPYSEPRHTKDEEFSEFMDAAIQRAMPLALKEYWDYKDSEGFPDDPGIIATHFKRWLCFGYAKIRERFPNKWEAVELFRRIEEECDRWLKYAEEGDRATLKVVASTGVVDLRGLEREWE